MKIWYDQVPPTENGLTDEAELIIYFPKNKTLDKSNPAVLICPGGGYGGLSIQYEGHAFAIWIASQGFTGIILKYRLPNQHKEVPFDDATQAMKVIKANSGNWKIDINKIGIAGFSAGGHLAAKFSNSDTEIKPAFTILFYPVISFKKATRGGTRQNLLGANPSATDIYTFSVEQQVTERTPPSIIFTADNDLSVPSIHSAEYYMALKEHQIPASLYIFPEGGHGWAMLDSFKYNKEALSLLSLWLQPFK